MEDGSRRHAHSAEEGGWPVTTDPLERLEQIALEPGSQRLASEARALGERVAAGRFYVACVGQVKRGKSTLLNALVGQDVLPTGVALVTAIPTSP